VIGATAVNNAIKKSIPGNNPVSLNDALSYSIKTFSVADDKSASLVQAFEDFPAVLGGKDYLIFMTVRDTESGADDDATTRRRYRLWFYWVSASGTRHVVRLKNFGSRIAGGGARRRSRRIGERAG